MPSTSYICSTCGKEHEGLPADWGFRLPDEVHELSYLDRYARSRSNADLCTLDERRYFVRGVLAVPLAEQDDSFGWGIWAEVDRGTHDDYVRTFNDDESTLTTKAGKLVNTVRGYSETRELPVHICFHGGNTRPTFVFPPEVAHGLAHEQRQGISRKRHHDILESLGFFDQPDA